MCTSCKSTDELALCNYWDATDRDFLAHLENVDPEGVDKWLVAAQEHGDEQTARALRVWMASQGREVSGCPECGQKKELRKCDGCYASAWVVDCGHSQQPCEIAASENGSHYFCEKCAVVRVRVQIRENDEQPVWGSFAEAFLREHRDEIRCDGMECELNIDCGMYLETRVDVDGGTLKMQQEIERVLDGLLAQAERAWGETDVCSRCGKYGPDQSMSEVECECICDSCYESLMNGQAIVCDNDGYEVSAFSSARAAIAVYDGKEQEGYSVHEKLDDGSAGMQLWP
jgi:hypothetical protein